MGLSKHSLATLLLALVSNFSSMHMTAYRYRMNFRWIFDMVHFDTTLVHCVPYIYDIQQGIPLKLMKENSVRHEVSDTRCNLTL